MSKQIRGKTINISDEEKDKIKLMIDQFESFDLKDFDESTLFLLKEFLEKRDPDVMLAMLLKTIQTQNEVVDVIQEMSKTLNVFSSTLNGCIQSSNRTSMQSHNNTDEIKYLISNYESAIDFMKSQFGYYEKEEGEPVNEH